MSDSVKLSKRLIALSESIITADEDYIYDPSHSNRPHEGGNWHKTERGWSKKPERGGSETFTQKDSGLLKKNFNNWMNGGANSSFASDAAKFSDREIGKYLSHDEFMSDSWSDEVGTALASNPNISDKNLRRLVQEELENPSVDIENAETHMAVVNSPNVSRKTLEMITDASDKYADAGLDDIPSQAMAKIQELDKLGVDVLPKPERVEPPAEPKPKKLTPEEKEKEKQRKLEEKQRAKEEEKKRDLEMKEIIKQAKNPKATPEDFKRALQDRNPFVRRSVMYNPNVTPDILDSLANDEYEYNREDVAGHDKTAPSTLRKLAKDPVAIVRKSAAVNEHIPVDLLNNLSQDKESGVRCGVARNLRTPVNILETLANDENDYVRGDVAKNPRTKSETIERLANNGCEFEVAQNPAAPSSLLERLSDHEDAEVRAEVARNPAASIETMTKLANDPLGKVREYVARNPFAPPELLVSLADKGNQERYEALKNPRAPKEFVERNAQDKDWYSRAGAAQNPFLSEEILKNMARNDESGLVRDYAKKNLKSRRTR